MNLDLKKVDMLRTPVRNRWNGSSNLVKQNIHRFMENSSSKLSLQHVKCIKLLNICIQRHILTAAGDVNIISRALKLAEQLRVQKKANWVLVEQQIVSLLLSLRKR